MVEGLLRAQADANLTDSEASTPLHRAANPTPTPTPAPTPTPTPHPTPNPTPNPNQASTPLHRAAAAGDGAAPCVRALLAAGATATVADGSGKSA